jgi:hypothetical protein
MSALGGEFNRSLQHCSPELSGVALEQFLQLEGGQFVSALAYAGSEGWLVDAPRKGWTSLTRVGEAIGTR